MSIIEILTSIFAFIVTLGILVFVHEWGHYYVARLFGVKADVFSIGFGKEITGWTDKRGTRWKLARWPLGGYVQFAGDMDPASSHSQELKGLPEEEKRHMFPAKPLWQRALIVFAGPGINFLLAIVIFAGFALVYGQAVTLPVVDSVQENSAAQKAGLQAGDKILSIDGEKVSSFEEIGMHTAYYPEDTLNIELERNGDIIRQDITLGVRIIKDRFGNEHRFGILGIRAGQVEYRDVSLLQAPVIGVKRTAQLVGIIVDTLGQVITGRRSVREMGGPLKIAQVSGDVFVMGVSTFISFIALISINLGFINLLPIPMLDGGHLLFYAIEAVRGKPPNPAVMEYAYRGGMAVLLVFMVFVTFNDLLSFGIFR